MTETKKRLVVRTSTFALLASQLMLGACGGDSAESAEDAAVEADGGDVGGDDGGTSSGKDGSAPAKDGGAAEGDDGAVGGDDADVVEELVAPTLSSGSFREVGRYGAVARIDVTGTSGSGAVVAASVTVYDAAGTPIALDVNGDNAPDGTTVQAALSAEIPAGEQRGSAYVEFPSLLRNVANVDHAEVTLVAADGEVSGTQTYSFVAQAVLEAGSLCDVTYVDNRCADDLGCKKSGTQVMCAPGVAPSIDKLGYYDDALGSRILLAVSDPDDDIASYTVYYLDSAKRPVLIDSNGDQVDDTDHLQFEAAYPGAGGSFVARLDVAQALLDAVDAISVIVTDRGGRSSVAKTVNKGAAPTISGSGTCDTRGFNQCAVGSVCMPTSTENTGKCTTLTKAHADACGAAQVLAPAQGLTSVSGTLNAPSLWEGPKAGCTATQVYGRPDSVVKLTLESDAAQVVLSTDHDLTNFDTVLYVLDSCDATPVVSRCWDDQPAGVGQTQRAVATLTNVSAGDYYIVVDSYPSTLTGLAYELSVEVQ